jgi:hypothetical protein
MTCIKAMPARPKKRDTLLFEQGSGTVIHENPEGH